VHEQGDAPTVAAVRSVAQKIQLLRSIDQVAAEQLRVQCDHAPPRHVELPEVLPEMLEIAFPALVRDRQQRRMRRRIVALPHIVVAWNEPARNPDRIMQAPRLGQIAFPAWPVQRHVAAIDDEIGTLGDEMRRDAGEVPGEERLIAAEMRVRDLGDAKGYLGSLVSHCDSAVMQFRIAGAGRACFLSPRRSC